MTRRRAMLAAFTAVLVVTGVLALPGAYWRLSGWLRGEPFYDGRPATYYASSLRRNAVTTFFRHFLADLIGPSSLPTMRPDAVPVLMVLLDDTDPGVRAFAAGQLARIGLPAAGPAVPALRRLKSDTAVVFPGYTVARAVETALSAIDAQKAGP